MKILAIETSCDDTCVAVVEADKRGYQRRFTRMKILSNIVSSQVKLHAKYGGVFPFLAKREHQKNLPIVLKKAMLKAGKPKIDLIAVTVGPGLEPCLWVGVNFAEELSKKLKLPIVPLNHIEAHIFANLLPQIRSKSKIKNQKSKIIEFPTICLVVSGGHTQLILMKNFGQYKILGETRDDAAGECFDKVARILGLGYPGGPIISKIAKPSPPGAHREVIPEDFFHREDIPVIKLPRPMIYQKNYDFSFSGLKTAVLYDFKSRLPKIRKSKKYIQEISAETQQAIIDVLIHKTLRAAKEYKAKTIILGGGVASNSELRKQFKEVIKKQLPGILYLTPDISYCTDNAVMVAAASYFHYLEGEVKKPEGIEANANLRLE